MDWLVEPFELAFMQRALLAGALTVVITSLVGTWVVLRGLTFVGDALAHGVLPGLAIAFLVGFSLTLGALASAAVMVAGIALIGRRSRVGDDVAIGLLFVGMLALGVVIVSRADSFTVDLNDFLFGSPLSVTTGDLWRQAGAVALTAATVALLHRPLLSLAFNAQKAKLLGFRPGATHAALLGLVAVAIVTSFRAVGTLLVFGLLIAPPATASLVARRVPIMMAVSVLVGWLAVVIGLLVSFHFDTAAGATISGTAVVVFFVALAGSEARDLRLRRNPLPAAKR